jgi:hypothetical protein
MENLKQVLASDEALLDQTKQLAVKGGNGGNDQSDPPDPPMWPIDWPDW